jgi:ComF family protein
LRKAPPWHALVAVDNYVPPLSALIHALKFSHQNVLATPLARLLLLAVLQARRTRALPRVDMLMNVPLHHRRHWRRGYNQSDLLCRPLARWLGCRYAASALRRVQATAIQHQLSARLRKRNLKNAFRLELPVHGLHIALVDDVVTTGSTVAELSRLLLQSGAASVQVWCLCRTL